MTLIMLGLYENDGVDAGSLQQSYGSQVGISKIRGLEAFECCKKMSSFV